MRALYLLWTEHAHRNPGGDWHIDWVMGPWCDAVRAYVPERFLVSQGRSQSDINGRVNPSRSWNPPSRTAPVLWLTCSRDEAEAQAAAGKVHLGFDRDEHGPDRWLLKAFAQRPPEAQAARLRRWADELQAEVEAGMPAAVVAL